MKRIKVQDEAGDNTPAFFFDGTFEQFDLASSLLIVGGYLFAINLLPLAAFHSDKSRAEQGAWRIPESTLLGIALIGGSPGAKWAQRAFRHKTRKQPFAMYLNGILVLHAVLAWIFLVPDLPIG